MHRYKNTKFTNTKRMSNKILILTLILLACLIVNCSEECNCKPLKQCSSFLRYYLSLKKPLSESSIELLRSKQCGIEDNSIKVCCEDKLTTITTASTTKVSSNTKCEEAQCISLTNCTPVVQFLDTIQKPLKACIVNYLRNQQCGFEAGFPKICCKPLPRYLRNQVHHKTKTKPLTTSDEDVVKSNKQVDTIADKKVLVPELEKSSQGVQNKKIDELNREFSDFFNDDDNFDLLLRQQRSLDANTFIGVEIR